MLLSHHDEAPCAGCDGIGQPSGEVIVIGPAVLILDDDVGPVRALRDDVDPSTTRGCDFGCSDRSEVQTDRRSKLV